MDFDLCTIDWTAVGSIVTFIAMIIAYWTIHSSNKQNESNQKFQLQLMQREIEQKRLDELVASIMRVNDSMKPTDVMDFSVKLINGSFSEDDRHILDNMAAYDKSENTLLSILLIKFDKKESAKEVLKVLSGIRRMYGEWIRDVSLLYMYKSNKVYDPSVLNNIITNMVEMTKKFSPECQQQVAELLKEPVHNLDKAIELMNVFSYAISSYLLEHKNIFEEKLCAFVEKEQKKIDNMVLS